jgi:hypothetical protein
MTAAAFLALLFVLIPLLSVRHGAESRPGFGTSPDWRRLDS